MDGSLELDYRPILDAPAYGNGSMVKLLIKNGCNVNLGAPRDVKNAEGEYMMLAGQRALHAAIDSYRLEIFRMLLKHGADPNATTDSGATPLMCACKVRLDIIHRSHPHHCHIGQPTLPSTSSTATLECIIAESPAPCHSLKRAEHDGLDSSQDDLLVHLLAL